MDARPVYSDAVAGEAQNGPIESVVGNDEIRSSRNHYVRNLLPANKMEQFVESTGVSRFTERGRAPPDTESSMRGKWFFQANRDTRNGAQALQNAKENGHLSSAYLTRRLRPTEEWAGAYLLLPIVDRQVIGDGEYA